MSARAASQGTLTSFPECCRRNANSGLQGLPAGFHILLDGAPRILARRGWLREPGAGSVHPVFEFLHMPVHLDLSIRPCARRPCPELVDVGLPLVQLGLVFLSAQFLLVPRILLWSAGADFKSPCRNTLIGRLLYRLSGLLDVLARSACRVAAQDCPRGGPRIPIISPVYDLREVPPVSRRGVPNLAVRQIRYPVSPGPVMTMPVSRRSQQRRGSDQVTERGSSEGIRTGCQSSPCTSSRRRPGRRPRARCTALPPRAGTSRS
jgi:hypothetical protein